MSPKARWTVNGRILNHNMYSSTDGVNYQKVTSGTWENSTIQELATFNPIAAKYVKLVVLNGVNGLTSVAEVNVFGY